jgi:hypothetical protein
MEKKMKAGAAARGGKFLTKRVASRTTAYAYSNVANSKQWSVDVVATPQKSPRERIEKKRIPEEAEG